MTHPILRISTAACLFATTLVATACDTRDAGPAPSQRLEQLDLSRFGVDAVEVEDDGFALLDPDGDAIGHVAIDDARGITDMTVSLAGHAAEVSWTDDAGSLRCDGGELVSQSTADATASTGEAAGTAACDDALAIGFEIADAAGIAPPWTAQSEGESFRLEELEQVAGVCSSVSTWVAGSSCWNCAQAARNAFGRGDGWYETSSSCSSGTLWTSCSATYCIN
ncbi:MAG: hypothetical protein U0168_16140 [Nannocystaceae bacterium]